MKDTSPEVNRLIFLQTMAKTGGERICMGFDMLATARTILWSRIPVDVSEDERRRLFYEKFYGEVPPF